MPAEAACERFAQVTKCSPGHLVGKAKACADCGSGISTHQKLCQAEALQRRSNQQPRFLALPRYVMGQFASRRRRSGSCTLNSALTIKNEKSLSAEYTRVLRSSLLGWAQKEIPDKKYSKLAWQTSLQYIIASDVSHLQPTWRTTA